MTDTREEYEEWCIETMPRQVAQWEIEHGHNSWSAWKHQKETIYDQQAIIDRLEEKLQDFIFAFASSQARVQMMEKKFQELQDYISCLDKGIARETLRSMIDSLDPVRFQSSPEDV